MPSLPNVPIFLLSSALLGGAAIFLYYFFSPILHKSKRRRLPPGPRPLPIIGNLHSLSPLLHRDVQKLSKSYGPILLLRFGSVPTVFISSPPLAEQVLKSHDLTFANRPHSEAARFMTYNYKGFAFTDYGPYWRGARKLSVTELLTPSKLDAFAKLRSEEMALFVDKLKKAAAARRTVDVTEAVRSFVADVVCRIVVGRKCMEESMDGAKFSEHIREVMEILGTFNVGDYVSLVGWFDVHGIRKRMRAVMGPLDRFFEKIIDEHVKAPIREEEGKDFVGIMLASLEDNYDSNKDAEFHFDRTGIKALILDIFEGALDTSPATIEWAFIELLRHPKAMNKVREELERVVGMHRAVEESDLPKLTYLEMVVKEAFRLHPIVPFLVHHTKQDCVLDGYNIPRNCNVFVSNWALSRDPELWSNPEDFIPERFEDGNIDVRGRDFRFLPFGSGRRGCPGMALGLIFVQLVLAQLVHCFDWELPNGMRPLDLDMSEKFGLIVPRAVHLHAAPIYRLCDHIQVKDQ